MHSGETEGGRKLHIDFFTLGFRDLRFKDRRKQEIKKVYFILCMYLELETQISDLSMVYILRKLYIPKKKKKQFL